MCLCVVVFCRMLCFFLRMFSGIRGPALFGRQPVAMAPESWTSWPCPELLKERPAGSTLGKRHRTIQPETKSEAKYRNARNERPSRARKGPMGPIRRALLPKGTIGGLRPPTPPWALLGTGPYYRICHLMSHGQLLFLA